MKEIETQVIQAENELLRFLRKGDIFRGVEMHLDTPDYRNIWNGEEKRYVELQARLSRAMEMGLQSIDYQVANRDLYVLDDHNVMATLLATETTHMANGESATSGKTVISILWRKVDGKWRIGYLHASEEPRVAANDVWTQGQDR